jgi:sterol desaturase/sphingolipid hydroxylase (fatty acid hydroxylase superfamily)
VSGASLAEPPFEIPPIVIYAVPVFVIAVIAEMIYVRMTGKGRYHAADAASSFAMALGSLVLEIALGAAVVAAHYAAHEFRLFDLGWTAPVLVACFFAEDLAFYWFHRISHERRWFWASHVVHHSSQHLNFTTAVRRTWTGVLGLAFIFWLPLSLIGFPPTMVLMFFAISSVFQFFVHTEVVKRLGPLEWVLNTPSHHRVHHAINPQYLDANYGGIFIIWDRLFGTFVSEDAREPARYGIISQIATFNPFRIAFHEWASMGRDVARAQSLREAWGYVMGPPGWSPDGSRKTSASLKAAWAAARAGPE